MHELRVTFNMGVICYYLLHELRINFSQRVTSYFLHASYGLILIARLTSYCLPINEMRTNVTGITSFFQLLTSNFMRGEKLYAHITYMYIQGQPKLLTSHLF